MNECEIPDRDIGGGETLRDLQHVNPILRVYEDWDSCIRRIVKVVQPRRLSSEPVTNANTSDFRTNRSKMPARSFPRVWHI